MKKIIAISAGRSDYDRYYPILNGLKKSKKAKLFIYLTQSNYNPKFGTKLQTIKKKFLTIKSNTKTKIFNDSSNQMIKNLCLDINNLSNHIKKIKPDLFLVMGDRYEMLMGPLIAMPYNIPIIHFFGGAITEGAIDELVRHGVTKMSHYHFVLLNQYRNRLINLGEESWRVKTIGMPSLTKNIKNKIPKNSFLEKYNLSKPYAILTFHPVTLEINKINIQISSLVKAIKKSKLKIIMTYPNADPEFNKIIKKFKQAFKDKNKFLMVKNLGQKNYFNILNTADLMIGNSSSGIVEAASFNLPVVNIGSRQTGKFKPKNVIDTGYNYKDILKGIKKAMNKNFKKSLKNLRNPYESKMNINNIIKLILRVNRSDKYLKKKFIDIK